MPVILTLRDQTFELEGTLTIKDALRKLGLPLESHLVVRDGQLLNDNEVLRNGEKVKIIAVISGG